MAEDMQATIWEANSPDSLKGKQGYMSAKLSQRGEQGHMSAKLLQRSEQGHMSA